MQDALRQLSAQTLLPRAVLVVDNGGTLRGEDLAHWPLSDRVTLVSRADNPGYGAAVNEARGKSTDAVLVLTHDAQFSETLAQGLCTALQEDAQAGAAAPALYWVSEPERVFSAGGVLHRTGLASHRTRLTDDAPFSVDWVDGAIVLYRTTALDAIGWLAEDYFLYFEDVDTAWRMGRAGWRTLLVPRTTARQQPGAHPLYLGVRNMTLFARRAGIPPFLTALAVLRRVAEESAVSLLRRHRLPELHAAARGWRDGRAGTTGKPAER